MNFLLKLKFLFKKPKVIIVTGNGRQCAKEAIFQVLNPFFKIGKDILIFEADLKNLKKFKFLINKSSLPILVVTQIGEIPLAQDFFTGKKEEAEQIRKLAEAMPSHGYLVLNFDDETVRKIAETTNLRTSTFGFQNKADFQASDIKLNGGTNFKINNKGNIVPVWLERFFGKEQIYSALSAACVGAIFDLNLVEISQSLKNYHFLSGTRNKSPF